MINFLSRGLTRTTIWLLNDSLQVVFQLGKYGNGQREPGRCFVNDSFIMGLIFKVTFKVLRDVFGHSSFRLSQEAVGIYLRKYTYERALRRREQVIKRLLVDGENALVLYPTGGTYIVDARALSASSLDK
jgi:hypothetical protein